MVRGFGLDFLEVLFPEILSNYFLEQLYLVQVRTKLGELSARHELLQKFCELRIVDVVASSKG